jgi:hypothetical protein
VSRVSTGVPLLFALGPTGMPTAIQCDANGVVAVSGGAGGGGLSVTAGAAVGTALTPVGGSDGTNAQFLRTDTSGRPLVAGAAAVGTAAGNPLTIGYKDAAGNAVAVSTPLTTPLPVQIATGALSNADAVGGLTAGVNTGGGSQSPLEVRPWVYRGDGTWDRPRLPIVFRTATATAAGNTALWTPAAGKKFRLMRFRVQVTGNAALAAAGILTVDLQDAAAAFNMATSVFVPGAAGTTMAGWYESDWVDLGQGYLSVLANNVLNINLSAALTAGLVRVQTAGTEE